MCYQRGFFLFLYENTVPNFPTLSALTFVDVIAYSIVIFIQQYCSLFSVLNKKQIDFS